VTTITATAGAGGVSATATDTTTVDCISISNPGFDLTPSTVIANRPVTFTGRVAAGSPPVTYTWDFDDDTVVQTGNPVAHTFANTGTYTVMMTATNICPSTKMITRTVDVVNAPDITVDPLQFDVRLLTDRITTDTLTIGNQGTVALSWNMTETLTRTWLSESLLGGSVAPSGERVVDMVFDSSGLSEDVYTTTLRIGSNDPDEGLVMVPVTMTVSTCEQVTDASFDYAPDEPETGETITFTAHYTPSTATGPISYTWNFGGDTLKHEATVTHSYEISATQTITLTVANACTPAVEHVDDVPVVQATRYIYLPLVIRNG
jgi:PKD repeat protein